MPAKSKSAPARKNLVSKSIPWYIRYNEEAEVAELVDALDSKSSLAQTEWGFESPLRHSMFIVYILRSLKDNNLYIGMTKNISERLGRHEKGRVPSTRNRRPLVLLHTEEYLDRLQARKREKYLKSGPGHRELTQLLLERRVPTLSG